MRLQDHIDFTTLQWVKPELDETLARAREALESYGENPGKREIMRACVDHLHQVQGTLHAATNADMPAILRHESFVRTSLLQIKPI